MAVAKLIFANARTRSIRTVLTVASVAMAVSLVVAVTSGYASSELAIFKYLSAFMGATDVQIVNGGDWRTGMPQSLVDDLRKDPEVVNAFGRLEADTGMLDNKEGKVIPATIAELIGVDRPADDDVTRTPVESGAWFNANAGDVAVIDQRAAELMKVSVGDTILLPGPAGKRKLTVVGICHKPGFFADRMQTIYVPLKTAQEIVQRPAQLTRVMARLKDPAKDQQFAARWEPRLKAIDPDLKSRLARDTRKEMDKQLQGIHLLSFLGGAVSLVSAAFIVFSTLSMGVAERQRTLAMLRAIGAYRSQIARLVLTEGLGLGMLGALAGVPLGIGWAWILTQWKPDFFTAGLAIDWGGVIMGVAGSGIAALLAGIIPAFTASRISPLEAMTPLARPTSRRSAIYCAAGGLLLVLIDPFIIFLSGASRDVIFWGHFFIGLPGLMIGAFLMAPLFVWLIDLLLSGPLARLLRIQPRLLKQQLSGGMWRAAGTAAALMVGLAIMVVMQTAGHSLLNGWKLPTKFPDVFVWITNQRISPAEVAGLEKVKGLKKGEITPLVIGAPGVPDFLQVAGMVLLPEQTMFIGIDPDLALKMMHLEFREGNVDDARAGLKKGGQIIVTEEFRVLKGLHVGDSLRLMTRKGPKAFKICGVVWSPGIDVMVGVFDLRGSIENQTAMTVFGSLEDADKEFGWNRAFLVAANLEPATDRDALLKEVRTQLGDKGWKAGDVRKIKSDIENGFRKVLLLLTTVAFSAMAVAFLGVTNTIMASVRSRQWQFGILRSIGVTRGQLLRLVIAEALLLAMVGIVLGLSLGFLMSMDAMGMVRAMIGYAPAMTPPWGTLSIGVGAVLVVAVIAGLWPAISVAKTEPLELLQAGRAAA